MLDLQENVGSDAMTLNGYYGTQQNVPGLVGNLSIALK